jgi:uncharacterized membrane protein HdeD (DUF308 family)
MTSLLQSFTGAIKHWYLPLIAGILFVGAGAYICTVPLATYLTLATLFSVSFICTGVAEIVFSIRNNKTLSGWGWFLVNGLLSLVIGVYLLMYPGISISILPFVVGFTLLFRSIQVLGYALDLKNLKIANWGILSLLGVLGMVFSFLLLAHPIYAGLSLVTFTALSFMVVGVGQAVLAFQLKKLK